MQYHNVHSRLGESHRGALIRRSSRPTAALISEQECIVCLQNLPVSMKADFYLPDTCLPLHARTLLKRGQFHIHPPPFITFLLQPTALSYQLDFSTAKFAGQLPQPSRAVHAPNCTGAQYLLHFCIHSIIIVLSRILPVS